jgi:multicomponent Na+:H+ antiporter subunit F
MRELHLWIALFLTGNLLLGLVRVVRGPSLPDRMVVAQLIGSTGVAVLFVLSIAPDRPALRNVALVLALLSPVALVAFARLAEATWGGGR